MKLTESQTKMMEESDAELKKVFTKYGVAEKDLAFCTIEVLLTIMKVMDKIRREDNADS